MIYFIRKGKRGPVKIGYSKDVAARLVNLKISHGKSLRVVRVVAGGYPEEREMHTRYAHLRIRGEWFSFCQSMVTIGIAVEPPPLLTREWTLLKPSTDNIRDMSPGQPETSVTFNHQAQACD